MNAEGSARFVTEQRVNARAINDLDAKKAKVLEALGNSGLNPEGIAPMTVLALLDHVPDKPQGPVAPPVDGRLAVQLVQHNVDRTANLNLAATAMAGAAL